MINKRRPAEQNVLGCYSLRDASARKKTRATGRPHSRDKVGRNAILDATIDLLKRTDPEAITLAQIAGVAGVARPLVTYYFGDLPSLLHEVTEVLMFDIQDRMRASLDASSSVVEKIRRRLELRLEFMREHPHFERLASRQAYWGECSSTTSGGRQALERGMELTRHLLEGLPVNEVDLRHVHVTIVGISAFLETGKPIMDSLFGKDKRGDKELGRYLDFIAQLLADYVQSGRRTGS